MWYTPGEVGPCLQHSILEGRLDSLKALRAALVVVTCVFFTFGDDYKRRNFPTTRLHCEEGTAVCAHGMITNVDLSAEADAGHLSLKLLKDKSQHEEGEEQECGAVCQYICPVNFPAKCPGKTPHVCPIRIQIKIQRLNATRFPFSIPINQQLSNSRPAHCHVHDTGLI